MAHPTLDLITTSSDVSGTWAGYSDMRTIVVECWGSGGTGGTGVSNIGGGGGGGGGAYSTVSYNVVGGETYTYSINKGNSNATIFSINSTPIVSAGNGQNGLNGDVRNCGGAGGTVLIGTGYQGGTGGSTTFGNSGGGGGGGAGGLGGIGGNGGIGGQNGISGGGGGGGGAGDSGTGSNGDDYNVGHIGGDGGGPNGGKGGQSSGDPGSNGGEGGGGGGGGGGSQDVGDHPGGNGGNGGIWTTLDIRGGGGGGGSFGTSLPCGTGGSVGGGGGGGNGSYSLTGATGAYGGIRLSITYGGPLPCYNHGTKILCANSIGHEEYIPIEQIKVGMLVKTFKHGYRIVENVLSDQMTNNIGDPFQCMFKMKKIDDSHMIDDLIVTGGHSILLDHPPFTELEVQKQKTYWGDKIYMIDGKYMCMACVSQLFEPIIDRNQYTYYHLVLETHGDSSSHYGIWANGVLSESISSENCQNFRYRKY